MALATPGGLAVPIGVLGGSEDILSLIFLLMSLTAFCYASLCSLSLVDLKKLENSTTIGPEFPSTFNLRR